MVFVAKKIFSASFKTNQRPLTLENSIYQKTKCRNADQNCDFDIRETTILLKYKN